MPQGYVVSECEIWSKLVKYFCDIPPREREREREKEVHYVAQLTVRNVDGPPQTCSLAHGLWGYLVGPNKTPKRQSLFFLFFFFYLFILLLLVAVVVVVLEL